MTRASTSLNFGAYTLCSPGLTMTTFKFDLSIFNEVTVSLIKDRDHSYLKCVATQRLLVSLKYYSQLDIKNNQENHEIFCNFMDEIYQHQIHDDYHHFIRFHQNELQAITSFAINNYGFTKCDLSTCHYSDRHFRTNSASSQITSNDPIKYSNIYIETMDSFHFYLMHLYESSFRISPTQTIHNQHGQEDP